MNRGSRGCLCVRELNWCGLTIGQSFKRRINRAAHALVRYGNRHHRIFSGKRRTLGASPTASAQTINESTPHNANLTAPTLTVPPNLVRKLSPQQQALLKKATPQQLTTLMDVVRPEIVKRLQAESLKHKDGIVKNWQEIIRGGAGSLAPASLTPVSSGPGNRSVLQSTFSFTGRAVSLSRPTLQ